MAAWDHAQQLSKLILFIALLNTVAAFVVTASRQNVPDATFWAERSTWIMVALAVTLGVPLTQAGIVELGERRRRKKLEREQDVQTFLSGALVNIANHGNADWETTGIQAFRLQRRWW